MTDSYGLHVRFTAKPGEGDALADLLLRAADGVRDVEECLIYVVSRSPGDPDTIWVTEAWTSQEAHDGSLEDEAVRALIGTAMPLIEGRPEATPLQPAGGKGL